MCLGSEISGSVLITGVFFSWMPAWSVISKYTQCFHIFQSNRVVRYKSFRSCYCSFQNFSSAFHFIHKVKCFAKVSQVPMTPSLHYVWVCLLIPLLLLQSAPSVTASSLAFEWAGLVSVWRSLLPLRLVWIVHLSHTTKVNLPLAIDFYTKATFPVRSSVYHPI